MSFDSSLEAGPSDTSVSPEAPHASPPAPDSPPFAASAASQQPTVEDCPVVCRRDEEMAPTSDFSLAESFAEIWIQQAISAHVSQLASDLPPFAPPLAPPPPTVEDGGLAGRGDEETALTDLVSSVFCNCVHAALLRAEGEGLFSSPAAAPDCPLQSVAAEPDALSHSALFSLCWYWIVGW